MLVYELGRSTTNGYNLQRDITAVIDFRSTNNLLNTSLVTSEYKVQNPLATPVVINAATATISSGSLVISPRESILFLPHFPRPTIHAPHARTSFAVFRSTAT